TRYSACNRSLVSALRIGIIGTLEDGSDHVVNKPSVCNCPFRAFNKPVICERVQQPIYPSTISEGPLTAEIFPLEPKSIQQFS
ncbi:hypothetical protein OFL77_27185, partial [Escherichia coli]|uniref:hypothetical protein n=1 Tax=Escherichia coli TaxID=562 RepID=UPI0021DFBF1D